MVAASAALTLPACPSWARSARARVGYHRRRVSSSTRPRRDAEKSKLDLVVAGTDDAVMMVESEAKELPEDEMLGGGMFGQGASSR